jgi:hypothetical protein
MTITQHAKEQFAKRVIGFKGTPTPRVLAAAERRLRVHVERAVPVELPAKEAARMAINNAAVAEYLYDTAGGVLLVKVGDTIVTSYPRKLRGVRFVDASKYEVLR